MTKKKYFEIYCDLTDAGILPTNGLCMFFKRDKLFKLLKPITVDEFGLYGNSSSIKYAYWAVDGETSGWNHARTLTTLRENIVLLMAAMNNEL